MTASINTPTMPTNTLIFTDFENHHFEETFLLKLRAQTETFGSVCFFSPIKTFHRIFVVYHDVFDAQRAKAILHNTRFQQELTLRVYFGQHTELSIDPEKYYLHLPDQLPSSPEKSGLMSPPGSPPVGHVDDQDMEAIEDFSLDATTTTTTTPSLSEATATATTVSTPIITNTPALPVVSETSKVTPQLGKLRIDTLRSTLASSLSPHSPITPTRLAFSPAVGSKGEQPFITIQDWGVQAAC
ncbi:hypothetical protein BGZ76_008130 [Entomortierella beljakovae]|nr:hypothetical protein BGZ76_008130 [Entomortierella beljakovae]